MNGDDAREESASRQGVVAELEIVNVKGLHARASARFSATVEQFDAAVTVSRQDLTVNGESIMGLLMLAASQGSTIVVAAQGAQAAQAVEALRALVADRFGEAE